MHLLFTGALPDYHGGMLKTLSALLVLTLLLPGQAPKEFDVASIRQASAQQDSASIGLRIDGSQVHISYLSLKDYIGMAYRVQIDQIVSPDWLSSERFDISAKLPADAKQTDVPEMLQNLLTDRFKLKQHREMRDFPVYVLEVAKGGLKVKESAPAEEFAKFASQPIDLAAGGDRAGVSIDYGNGSVFTLGATTIETRKLTMLMFSNLLTRFMDKPVVDQTELKGGYDLKLELTSRDRTTMLVRSAVSAGVTLPAQALALLNLPSDGSLENALNNAGFSLASRKVPREVVVVDDMLKTPTDN